jgi:hypothetical protein
MRLKITSQVHVSLWLLALGLMLGNHLSPREGWAADTTYYVSSSDGADSNTGLSSGSGPNGPFKTIAKINALALQPGDAVLFKCGDVWRAEMLVINKSGMAADPLTFASYPGGCANKPVLSGAQSISGWTAYGGNIYYADLSAGANAGIFTNGINQLFRNGDRLPLGRWPNLDAGDGYSTIDSQPAANRFTDAQLPAVDWSGAVAHIKGMRWYILNRQVSADSGSTLTVGADLDCWGGNCIGWGFFLNNHLGTLDREGEWYYNPANHRVYLYTTGGAPAAGQIEGSVILKTDARSWGGVLLGEDLNGTGISYVGVENLDVRRWFRHGIATPTNLAGYENHHITLQNNSVMDVDGIGINLMTWVWGAQDGRPDGWRGGYSLTLGGNTIERANSMGINTCGRQSTLIDNVIRDVGMVQNLGAAGLGCAFNAGGGACTEDGDGIRIKTDKADDTGNYNILTGNRLERIAYNGVDVFGHHNTLDRNVITQACHTKGDCGGVRTFGRDNLSASAVHDLTISNNIIIDIPGNTDGCHTTYRPLFGMGLYIDNYSRDVLVTGNSIINTTFTGILYQQSTGQILQNTVYNAASGSMYTGQVNLAGSSTEASLSNNIMYGLTNNAWTLYTSSLSNLSSSDYNYFFHPYINDHIGYGPTWTRYTFAGWQSFSGRDSHSKTNWFTQNSGTAPLSVIFYNDTKASRVTDLGNKRYLDLYQNQITGNLTLAPFTSKVLIVSGEIALAPDLLYFDSSASPPQTVTLKNITANPLTPAITISPGFAQTNDCPASLAAGQTCTIDVSFTAGGSSAVTGTLTVSHNAGAPYTVSLHGNLLKLTTEVSPPGGGAVTPDCSAGCYYSIGSPVTLTPTPAIGYTFNSWTGDVSSLNAPLTFTLNGSRNITVNFDSTPITGTMRIAGSPPTYFSSLQQACAAAENNDVIQMQATAYDGAQTFDNYGLSVTLKGGYNATYSDNAGQTVVGSPFSVKNGTIIVENITIK